MKTLMLCMICSCTALASVNIPLEPGAEPPALLSETGILTSEMLDYKIIQPLWVDFAVKQRRIFIPEGAKIHFSPTADYKFPVGTVFVKHFQMEVSKDVFRNIETRVLIRKNGDAPENWVGYTYQWDGADAKLVDAGSNPEVTLQIDETAVGGARLQKFKIPSRTQCLQCHNESVGFVRSFVTRQLNQNGQLELFAQKGIFAQQLEPSSHYEKLAAVTDESADLGLRARSYADVNCAHCHNPSDAAMCSFTGLDFRFAQFSPEALVESGHLVKGDKANSEIFQRMSSVRTGMRMPFIGTTLRDEAALDTIGRWIDSLH